PLPAPRLAPVTTATRRVFWVIDFLPWFWRRPRFRAHVARLHPGHAPPKSAIPLSGTSGRATPTRAKARNQPVDDRLIPGRWQEAEVLSHRVAQLMQRGLEGFTGPDGADGRHDGGPCNDPGRRPVVGGDAADQHGGDHRGEPGAQDAHLQSDGDTRVA